MYFPHFFLTTGINRTYALLLSVSCNAFQHRQILTNRHISHNKPDVLLIVKAGHSAYIIDVAFPHNSNMEWKYGEKPVDLGNQRLESVFVVAIILSAGGRCCTHMSNDFP